MRIIVNIGVYIVCFVSMFFMTKYIKPLYNITYWVMEKSYQKFYMYLDCCYEPYADPIRFTALIVCVMLYSLLPYWVYYEIVKAYRKR